LIIDLHTHTKPWSDDSNLEATELIYRAKRAGLDGICLTEHDWFWDRETIARLSEGHHFLVLPGVEINTEEGHFLVFGLEQYSFGMWHVETLRSFVDDVGGVMILAHPYRRRLYMDDIIPAAVERYYQRPFFKLADSIEVLNGKATARQNQFSQELCRRLGLKGIGGSDAHVGTDIPSSATLFERTIGSVTELIAEIKAGRFQPIDLRQPTAPEK
jgi:hypothetical protein